MSNHIDLITIHNAEFAPEPRVGIVIPVHNRRQDLAALLQSLAGLRYCNYDILVVDNGSADNVWELQQEFTFELLPFAENLGAIRGFNAGARSFVQRGGYQYIWLLDSDLTVHAEALRHSVGILEENHDIGICVSIIYNIHDKDIVVEAGGMINLRQGRVSARLGNEQRRPLPVTEDVDYASCGMSLLRVSMIEKIGLYEERYHFLWEDMDYGIFVRKNGWRVVVSSRSELYHPPFTEKRNPNIYAYYGVRNPLLTVSRHTPHVQLPYYLLNNLFKYIRIALLMSFSGVSGYAVLTAKALVDFIAGRFGAAELWEITAMSSTEDKGVLVHETRIHVVGTASRDVVEAAFAAIKKETAADIVLVVQRYRATLFEKTGFDRIMIYDDHTTYPVLGYLRIGLAILAGGGCVINTDLTVTSPLAYCGKRVYDWHHTQNRLYRSRLGLGSVWQPILAFVIGIVLSVLLVPLAYAAALKHRRKQTVIP